jgi:hypothetical protein
VQHKVWSEAASPGGITKPKPDGSAASLTTASSASHGSSKTMPRQPAGEERVRWILADPDFDWKTPIEFYGKVVDERGVPVREAGVQFMWTDLSTEGTSTRETSSDSQGLFSLSGVRGKRLVVTSVTKDGYYTSARSNRFSFEYANPHEINYHVPDPRDPVIFHLWKKGVADPLVHRYIKLPLKRDGQPVRLDLDVGQPKATGQLEIRAWNEGSVDPVTRRFDWWMSLSVAGGGLIETDEEFAFLAPEQGYVESKTYEFLAASPEDWKPGLTKQFIIAFDSPRKYARMNLRVQGQGSMCYIDFWSNPSGSRVLEFDPAVQPKSKIIE